MVLAPPPATRFEACACACACACNCASSFPFASLSALDRESSSCSSVRRRRSAAIASRSRALRAAARSSRGEVGPSRDVSVPLFRRGALVTASPAVPSSSSSSTAMAGRSSSSSGSSMLSLGARLFQLRRRAISRSSSPLPSRPLWRQSSLSSLWEGGGKFLLSPVLNFDTPTFFRSYGNWDGFTCAAAGQCEIPLSGVWC